MDSRSGDVEVVDNQTGRVIVRISVGEDMVATLSWIADVTIRPVAS